jgi:glycosyltransferase involved in cell wall biosynthesis
VNKKILVGSLQYSPIYKSHCCAFGKQCEHEGFNVKYLFSHQYEWMLDNLLTDQSYFIGTSNNISSALADGLNPMIRRQLKNVIINEKPTHIYMHNYHPILNLYLAKISNKYGVKFIQHIHEPYVENKAVYGGFHQYWLYLFEYLQGKLLEKTDTAILSSNVAYQLFNKRYPHFSGNTLQIPLMYEDLGDEINTSVRKYITFIGPPVTAKGPETFLEIINYSEAHKLGLQFLIISRAQINTKLFSNKSLRVYCKEKISDNEMSDLVRQSVIMITPYKTARQSSVVLTSYMHGIPVLSTDIDGLKESVIHKKTGYLVETGAGIEEWIEGINYILNNFNNLEINCRQKFINDCSEKNWPKYLGALLGDQNE